jgi:SAM-dependent methyltransferase
VGTRSGKYVPALGHDLLTPLYDIVIKWTLPESAIKRRLVRQAGIGRGARVLDLGCGTATLTLLVKKEHPDADVTGIDGDPKILEIARLKAGRAEGLQGPQPRRHRHPRQPGHLGRLD